MSPLEAWLISLLAGGGAGLIGGVFANWLLDRDRRPGVDPSGQELKPDPSMDARVDEAASYWAREHGRPGAEPIVGDKLRLALLLEERRRRGGVRTRRGWSRR